MKKASENMLKNMLTVVNHYDKHFIENMGKVDDPRNQSYITYPMEVMLITRLLAFSCHIQSMAELNDDFNSELVIKNISMICGTELENLPHGDTINDLFCRLDINSLRNLLTETIKNMITSRFFEKYRYKNVYYQLVIDGTQLYSFDQNHIEKSLVRTHENGSKTYLTQSLTAYFVIGDNLMIPVDFEIIENEEENTTKQNCELNASKRLLKRIKKNYPRLNILLSADALYACEPIIEICEKNRWHYIIRLKEGSIPSLVKEYEELKALEGAQYLCDKTMKHDKIVKVQEYWYVNDIEYENHTLSVVEIKEKTKSNEKTFLFMTDLEINEKNVREISKLGRKRWKIENKGFNDETPKGWAEPESWIWAYSCV